MNLSGVIPEWIEYSYGEQNEIGLLPHLFKKFWVDYTHAYKKPN